MHRPTSTPSTPLRAPRLQTRRATAALLVVVALVFAGCGADSDDAVDVVDDAAGELENTDQVNTSELADALRDNGLDTLASAVESVDLSELVGEGEFTFLAPSNDAFLSLDADTTADLLSDPAQILETLQNHVVSERVVASDLAGRSEIATKAGNSFAVSSNGTQIMIGPASVTEADISVGNGVVHVVDTLLIP